MPKKRRSSKPAQSSTSGPRRNGQPAPHTIAFATRCPKCGSTEREPYYQSKTVALVGRILGMPFDHVTFRRTRCKHCGQIRVERTYELHHPVSTGSKTRTGEVDRSQRDATH